MAIFVFLFFSHFIINLLNNYLIVSSGLRFTLFIRCLPESTWKYFGYAFLKGSGCFDLIEVNPVSDQEAVEASVHRDRTRLETHSKYFEEFHCFKFNSWLFFYINP